MKFAKKMAAFGAAVLAVCLMLTSCSSTREETGVANEKNMSITSAEDLAGKAVAVQLRSAADDYVVSHSLTDFPKRYENLENAVQDLMDKKVAVVIADSNYAQKLVADNEGIEIVKGSIGSIDYRFLLSKSAEVSVDDMNAQITALKASDSYSEMIGSELVKGETYAFGKDDQVLDKTLLLVSEPYFKPYAYESENGGLQGFFVTAADAVAYGCQCNLTVSSVKAGEVNAALAGDSKAFCVVHEETDDEAYITTEPFYTSELVMIIRTPEKKK